jgi:succinate dehydrogenase / fumarate reductase cytochrome b subunit
MSSGAAPSRVLRVWQAPIGKKAIMAVTGIVLYGFVFAHMAGNLQFFLGPAMLDAYGAKLQEVPAIIWTLRSILIVSVILHIASALSLSALKRQARPKGYTKRGRVQASYAATSMGLGGLLLLAFVIFHILHFTTGQAHPDFHHGEVYRNVVVGFSRPLVVGIYLLAMVALALHLYHGVWSSFRSLGLGHPGYSDKLRTFAKVFAVVVTLGFAALPIAVLLGRGKGVL